MLGKIGFERTTVHCSDEVNIPSGETIGLKRFSRDYSAGIMAKAVLPVLQ